ncbi:MAG: PadR family transcriptional regulator [Jatrophihabitantaceae bacterium]
MIELPQLSLAEWIVLALIAEQPRHGFAIAALTAHTGEIGRAWHVPRPIVYRAAARLTERGLVALESTERGGRGPQRSVLAATVDGSKAVRLWLGRPVVYVRDGRSELLVKLALLERRGRGPLRLIAAQRTAFARVEAALNQQQDAEDGFGRVLASWRVETVRAALRFLDDVQAQYERPVGVR